MEWRDEGVVLGIRRHGEASTIVELMTRDHGRHLGLVRGGRTSRMRPVLQPGNSVLATWGARLDEHLGNFRIEGSALRVASLLGLAHAVHGVMHLAALCRLLPERDPHPAVHAALTGLLDGISNRRTAGQEMARFELMLLAELGFGLALDRCAATGQRQDLAFVSPKSGRAVSLAAGAPFKDKLLPLPAFLLDENSIPSMDDLSCAFRLTGLFLSRHLFEPRGAGMPHARACFLDAVLRSEAG
jgi:DNA repair protein RecO (recombination protein O)